MHRAVHTTITNIHCSFQTKGSEEGNITRRHKNARNNVMKDRLQGQEVVNV